MKPTYNMIQRADTIGVFQIESRAQMSMLPRLRPKKFYDLVIEVAIVRPGPIQGNMVHPYLRRRERLEKVTLSVRKDLEEILEQDARRAAVPGTGHAHRHRRRGLRAGRGRPAAARDGDLQACRHHRQLPEEISQWHGWRAATTQKFATDCWSQIEGFGSYGFPESHAASFANLVYASAWIKCHYPDVFAAALLNSQPMGFYATAQLVRDAQEHGVEVRPVDVNRSDWDCTLEAAPLGPLHPRHASMQTTSAPRTRCVSACARSTASPRTGRKTIESVRGEGFDSVRDLWLRTGLPPRGAGEARARRRLRLARPQPPRCAVGGEGAAPRGRQGRPAAVRACRDAGAGAGRASAADAAGPAGGRGLSPPASVAEGASGVVPARRSRCARHRPPRPVARAWPRAGASPSPASCWCGSGRAPATPSS